MSALGATASTPAATPAAVIAGADSGAAASSDVVDKVSDQTTDAGDSGASDSGDTGDTDAGSDSDTGADAGSAAAGKGAADAGKGATDSGASEADKAQAAADAWRTMIAGDNQDVLKELSRIKTAADLGKVLLDQKKALSKRAEAPKLPENATPKQVAEYRKLMGVPEVAEGAKPEDYAKAYGIDAPKDYQISEVEKSMLAGFAETMHSQHVPAHIVKGAADFFFKAQTANQQQMNVIDQSRQKEWIGELKSELGKDYEPMIAAGEAYLNKEFEDNPTAKAELLNARLPGGGCLGDNPWFIKRVVDAALNNGFADRIEANEMEGGGKSLEAQQQEIEALWSSDRAKYDMKATQEKLNRILELRLSRGEIDANGKTIKKR